MENTLSILSHFYEILDFIRMNTFVNIKMMIRCFLEKHTYHTPLFIQRFHQNTLTVIPINVHFLKKKSSSSKMRIFKNSPKTYLASVIMSAVSNSGIQIKDSLIIENTLTIRLIWHEKYPFKWRNTFMNSVVCEKW